MQKKPTDALPQIDQRDKRPRNRKIESEMPGPDDSLASPIHPTALIASAEGVMIETSPISSEAEYISDLNELFELYKEELAIETIPQSSEGSQDGGTIALSEGIIRFFFPPNLRKELTDPQKDFFIMLIQKSLTVGVPAENHPKKPPSGLKRGFLGSFYQDMASYLQYPKDYPEEEVYWKGFSRFLRIICKGLNLLSLSSLLSPLSSLLS